MCRRRFVGLAAAVLGGALWMLPATAWADLTPYSQDFEGLELATGGSTALSDDGWVVFGNVYDPGGGYLYGYGVFPAPNDGAAFCAVVTGQGGVPQGDRQLSVFSDYNNGDHGNGNLIESNVFQEQTVGAADVGSTWTFEFDAKLGNLVSPSTATAFIKTLDPNAGYALTNFVTVDMTTIPTTWDTYSVSLAIDGTLPGQIFQFGFLNVATNYDGSGVFYDNVSFTPEPTSLAILALGGLALLRRRRR